MNQSSFSPTIDEYPRKRVILISAYRDSGASSLDRTALSRIALSASPFVLSRLIPRFKQRFLSGIESINPFALDPDFAFPAPERKPGPTPRFVLFDFFNLFFDQLYTFRRALPPFCSKTKWHKHNGPVGKIEVLVHRFVFRVLDARSPFSSR
jgi:hypothetical protein